MKQLDARLIRLLRQMATKRCFVADMVRAIRPDVASTVTDPVEVLRYFRDAFELTLAQVKPIADWLAYGGGELDEAELHNLVWPCIAGRRDSWEPEGVNACI